MKSLFLASAALLATLFVGVSAEAGFFGESYLRAYNARVEVADSSVAGGWRKAVNGQDLDVVFAFSSGSTSATLNGANDGETVTTVFGSSNFSPTAPNANRGYVGSGVVADDAGFPGGTGVVPGAGSPYSYSDVTAVLAGQLIDDGSGTTPDSDVSVMVSSLLDANDQFSSAISSVGTTAQVEFAAATGTEFRLVFDYDLEQSMSLIAPPDSASGSVRASFAVSGNSDDNTIQGVNAGVFSLAFGDGPRSESGLSFTSGTLEVGESGFGSFGFTRGASLVMVPEPGTLAVFGLSALGLCAVGYRRRRNA